MSGRLHTTAVHDLLSAQVTTYLSVAPNNSSGGYVVLHTDQGHGHRATLAAATDHHTFTVQTTAVGDGPEQAQWAADLARTALQDVRPTVAGWACSPIHQLASQTVRRDDDVDPPVFYAVDLWRYTATPT